MPSSDSSGRIAPRAAADQRVLNLQIGNGVDRLRATDGLRSHFGQADRADVPGLHEIGDRANRLFDRDGGIQAAGPIDVDVIDAQPRERVPEKVLHRGGPRVHADPASVRAAQGAELHREQRLIATILKRPADQQLVMSCTVVVAGVEQRDALVERGMNRGDALALVGRARTCRTCPCNRVPAERPLGPPSRVDEGDGVRLMSSADARSVGFSWQGGTREFYTSHRETMPARGVRSPVAVSKKESARAGNPGTRR